MKTHSTSTIPSGHSEDSYSQFLQSLVENFEAATKDERALFTTDATGLWEAFLSGFAEGPLRQHYNCHACQRFVETYGGLVSIDELGITTPAVWPDAAAMQGSPYFGSAFTTFAIVERARVTGVFLSKESTWGTPQTGDWHHMHVTPRRHHVFESRLLTPGQVMAEKREEHGMLCRALADFPVDVVARALPLLETDALYRSEKCLGVAKWLHGLQTQIADVRGPRRDNLIWRAVATAPAGWCHVRSTMIGTLLEDIAAGMDFDAIATRFKDKMHPLQYQRPTTPPSAGNIDAAEKLVEKLGIARSLERRYARLEDIKALWTPKPAQEQAPSGGVFAHLRGGYPAPELHVPAQRITWQKFATTVLPNAESITYQVPSVGPFITLVTAVHPDAPPILQWDREERRNPVSWYVQIRWAHAHQYQLNVGARVKVTAVCLFPNQWDEERSYDNHGKGAIFLLEGAVEQGGNCLGLFPECLRSELHGIRSVIERHQITAPLSGKEEASACGVDLRKWDQTFRVKVAGLAGTVDYLIDRWD
jgi:hypothetical protein